MVSMAAAVEGAFTVPAVHGTLPVEKFTAYHLLSQMTARYEIQMFNEVFTRIHHWFLFSTGLQYTSM